MWGRSGLNARICHFLVAFSTSFWSWLRVSPSTVPFSQGSSNALHALNQRAVQQNHRITECYGLEGTSVGHPAQPSRRSRVTYSRPQRTLSRWVLNISREGDSTTSLGSLGQGSVTLRGKKFFLIFRQNFLCFSLCPLPLILLLCTTEMNLAPSSWHPPCRYL